MAIEAIKSRELRGNILRVLARAPFREITAKGLAVAVKAASEDAWTQVLYLEDKEYVAVREDAIFGCTVRLTARGVDLIEESIPADSGILF